MEQSMYVVESENCWHHLFVCNKEMAKNPENRWKSMIIANIDREILHNFWTTWAILMKFSGKMWLMIILKVTKNLGFTFSLEDKFSGKLQGGRGDIWGSF